MNISTFCYQFSYFYYNAELLKALIPEQNMHLPDLLFEMKHTCSGYISIFISMVVMKDRTNTKKFEPPSFSY
jgi:hypothetical protein